MSEGTDIMGALRASESLALAGGVWRLYSGSYPTGGGIDAWNTSSAWRVEWGLDSSDIRAFGEDLFGNQLIIHSVSRNVFLWNHENGEQHDLLLEPVELCGVVLESGLDWIDFYHDGSLAVARSQLATVAPEQHVHWTTPLILGGPVSIENTSLVERVSHLVGHAKLWRQICDEPPGSFVVPR